VIVPPPTVFLDTSFVLALENRDDPLHSRAKAIQLLERFEREEGYRLYPISAPLMDRGLALYRGRQDKDWGLTDCLSFALMEQEGVREALTADVHFRQAGFVALLLAE
jgi:predicted nucleic acid-binding protein